MFISLLHNQPDKLPSQILHLCLEWEIEKKYDEKIGLNGNVSTHALLDIK